MCVNGGTIKPMIEQSINEMVERWDRNVRKIPDGAKQ